MVDMEKMERESRKKRQSLGEEAEAIGKRGRCIKVNASIYM